MENKKEHLNLKTSMLVDGYETYETDYFDTLSYKKLRGTILDDLPSLSIETINFRLYPKSEILKSGRFVIDKHFGKRDLRIPYANDDDMTSQLIALFGKKPKQEQYDEIIDYIKNQIEHVRVTDIPVLLDTSAPKGGFVVTTWFYNNKSMKEEFYKKLPNCVRQIVLKGDCDIDTQTIYVHEMSHALINRHKGNIINLLNNEAFSIFMEKVAALDLEPSGEFLDFKILKRILQIKRCLLEKELLECKKDDFEKLIREEAYILSALNATALFDTYLKGKAKLRKEIDNALGDVISGDEILENVFDYYEATPEKGAKIMQKQIKKYGKKIQYKETSKA